MSITLAVLIAFIAFELGILACAAYVLWLDDRRNPEHPTHSTEASP